MSECLSLWLWLIFFFSSRRCSLYLLCIHSHTVYRVHNSLHEVHSMYFVRLAKTKTKTRKFYIQLAYYTVNRSNGISWHSVALQVTFNTDINKNILSGTVLVRSIWITEYVHLCSGVPQKKYETIFSCSTKCDQNIIQSTFIWAVHWMYTANISHTHTGSLTHSESVRDSK